MTLFLVGAGLLFVLTLFAVLRPLLARSPRAAIGIAVATLAASIALYLHVGTPAALDPAMTRAPQTLAEARVQLERKLEQSPADAEGWRLLGRAYTAEGKSADAARAYAQAAKHAPEDPDVLVEAAEASALARDDHRFDADAIAQLERALQLNANHQRARWFLGISQRQAGKPADAAATWASLLPLVDAKTATSLLPQINEARAEAGLAAIAAPAAPSQRAGLPVQVDIAPALKQRLASAPNAVVFVIARKAGGPPMPVAARRLALSELPADFILSDADSPMPTQKLSSMQEVEVLARVSMTGDAGRGEGDIETPPVRVKLPAHEPIRLQLAGP